MNTLTQSKTEYLTECLLEVVNNEWKVNATESGRSICHKLEYSVGKKYIKVNQFRVHADGSFSNNGVFMFIDKESGACYKPASYKAPAKLNDRPGLFAITASLIVNSLPAGIVHDSVFVIVDNCVAERF